MSEAGKPAVIDFGMAMGLCAAISMMIGAVASQGMPAEAVAFAMLLLPFLPIPVALLTARHGFMTGSLAGIVIGSASAAWFALTGTSVGLIVFLFAAVAGVVAGSGFRAGSSIYRLLVILMVLYTGMIVSWFGAYNLASDVGPLAALEDFTGGIAEQSSGFYESIGIVQGSQEEIASQVRDAALYSLPSLLLIIAGAMSIATVAFSRLVFRSMKAPFPRDIGFSQLRLHFGFVYMFIVSMSLLLAGFFLDGTANDWAMAAGENLMILTNALFFIQGLAISAWFLRERKASGIMKTVVYVALVVTELLFYLVSLVGMLDVFVDFRKRYSDRNSQGKGST